MSLGEVIYLGFIIFSFVTFGTVLAATHWYERSGARRERLSGVRKVSHPAVSAQIPTKRAA